MSFFLKEILLRRNKVSDIVSGFRNEVKKFARVACKLHYGLDVAMVTITEDGDILPDTKVVERVKHLLTDDILFLRGTDANVGSEH
jgi:hypothetical protein